MISALVTSISVVGSLSIRSLPRGRKVKHLRADYLSARSAYRKKSSTFWLVMQKNQDDRITNKRVAQLKKQIARDFKKQLTMSGLKGQGELNVDVADRDASEKLLNWFNQRWEDRHYLRGRRTDHLLQEFKGHPDLLGFQHYEIGGCSLNSWPEPGRLGTMESISSRRPQLRLLPRRSHFQRIDLEENQQTDSLTELLSVHKPE